MDDGDLLVLQFAQREFGPELALLVVAAAGAESVPQAAIGDFRIGRRRRDEQDAVVGIDFGGGDGHAGVEVADHEFDAVADEFIGDRNALLGIGNVVALFDFDFLAENAAGLVDVFGGLRDAIGQLRAERGVGAGDRAGDADLDLGACGAGEGQARGEHETGQPISSSYPTPSCFGRAKKGAHSVETPIPPWRGIRALFFLKSHLKRRMIKDSFVA